MKNLSRLPRMVFSGVLLATGAVANINEALAQKVGAKDDLKVESVGEKINNQYQQRLKQIQSSLKEENLSKFPEPMRSERKKRLEGELERWIAVGNRMKAEDAYSEVVRKFRKLQNDLAGNIDWIKIHNNTISMDNLLQKTGQGREVEKAKAEILKLEAENVKLEAEMKSLSELAKPLNAEYQRLKAIEEKLMEDNYKDVFGKN
jgi:hypothetical protein